MVSIAAGAPARQFRHWLIGLTMRRTLTIVLALYWMAEFAILAASCVARFDDGLQAALAVLGAERLPAVCADGGLIGAAAFGAAFGLVALLFVWLLLTSLGSEARAQADEVAKLAFAAGALSMTAVVLAGAMLDVTDVFPAAAVELLALLASYLVTQAEGRSTQMRRSGPPRAATLPRAMAVNAAVQYSAAAGIRQAKEGSR